VANCRLRASNKSLKPAPPAFGLRGGLAQPLDGSIQMKRYAAKLLFDWNPDPVTRSRRTRLFEERIVVFNARSARGALAAAQRLGGQSELRYDSGLRLRFVGLMQVMETWSRVRGRRGLVGVLSAAHDDCTGKPRLPADDGSLYVFPDDKNSEASARAASSRPQRAASRLTTRFNRRPRRPRLSA
jgi:hypothetical protein